MGREQQNVVKSEGFLNDTHRAFLLCAKTDYTRVVGTGKRRQPTAWRQRVDEGLGLALPCHNSCLTGHPNEASHRVYLCRRTWRFPCLGVDRLPRDSLQVDRREW